MTSGLLDRTLAKAVVYVHVCRILFGDLATPRRLSRFFNIFKAVCPRWTYRFARALRDNEPLHEKDLVLFIWAMEKALGLDGGRLSVLIREALLKSKRFETAFKRQIFCDNCLHYQEDKCPYKYQDLTKLLLPHVRCGRYEPYLSESLHGVIFLRLRHALYHKCPKYTTISLKTVAENFYH